MVLRSKSAFGPCRFTMPRMAKIILGVFSVLSGLLGCTPGLSPYVFLQYGKELRPIDLAKVVAENPLGPNENIKLTTFGQSQSASHHVVQIRERESPHMHTVHDDTVMIVLITTSTPISNPLLPSSFTHHPSTARTTSR
jgi:hypothetical protein